MSAARAPHRRRTPWRDNIEAMTVAVVMAVFLKYFLVEAYKIPTGSMQPTLMGQPVDKDGNGYADGGVFDRILVDKLSFHMRSPERFEVVVFKYPLDRSKNFVKRLVGMPEEDLRIADGDVWIRPTVPGREGGGDWSPLRRPRSVQKDLWKPLDLLETKPFPSWKPDAGASAWRVDGRSVSAKGDGRALFNGHGGGPIRDVYTDGYPPSLRPLVPPNHASGANDVGDLRVAGQVTAGADCAWVLVDLQEGPRQYHFAIPGPAAPQDARPSVVFSALSPEQGGIPTATAPARSGYRLPAGRAVRFGAQNLDGLLELDIGGKVVAALEVPRARDQRSAAWIGLLGGEARFDDLQVFRDIYYTPGNRADTWTIPAGHYFMLGDNTQDSSDSREWTFWNMRWSDAEEGLRLERGNYRPQHVGGRNLADANPVRLQTAEGPLTWFRDEWGELHVFGQEREAPLSTHDVQTPSPFVPRELITGRALLVFWPLSPGMGIYRLKWIR